MNGNKLNRVTFFGDSICVGQGVSIHKGWVTRIASKVSDLVEKTKKDIVITNASVNGNTTRLALERMPYDIQSHGVDIMILQFGMNDCNYWESDKGLPRVGPKAFKANLDEIIRRATTFGAKKVLMNTNHMTTLTKRVFPNTNITYQESNNSYNQIIRDVALELKRDVILNDIEYRFQCILEQEQYPLGEYLLEDGLHLSEKGHDVYYKSIIPVLESTIDEVLA